MRASDIPVPPRWARRIQHVLWPAVTVGVTAAAAPVAGVGVLLWPVDRRLRLMRLTWLATETLWADTRLLVGCWRLRLQDPDGRRERGRPWREAHRDLFADALDRVMDAAGRWVDLRVELDGPLDLGEPGVPDVVMARHAGPGDSVVLAWLLAHENGRVPRVVLSEGLRWMPGVDIALSSIDSYFVPSRSGAGDDRAEGVARVARSMGPTDTMLIFPEGTNFTPARRTKVLESLRRKGETAVVARADRWQHVLPPRPAGVVAALLARSDADVLVVAHTGLEDLDSAWDMWRALPLTDRTLRLRSATYAAKALPADREGLEEWLNDRWHEVDAWIAQACAGRVRR